MENMHQPIKWYIYVTQKYSLFKQHLKNVLD